MAHYKRLKLYGDPLGNHPSRSAPKTCSIAGCGKPKEIRGWCQMHHWRWKKFGDPLREPYPTKLCSLEGCALKHKAGGLCLKHYRRKKSGVPLDYVRPVLAKKRYRVLTRPDHPLAWPNGRVSEHRMVLYDSIGVAVVPCFWCGKGLSFAWNNLVVDHLNHDRHDNRLKNLVPSCNGCNAGRTATSSQVRTSIYAALLV